LRGRLAEPSAGACIEGRTMQRADDAMSTDTALVQAGIGMRALVADGVNPAAAHQQNVGASDNDALRQTLGERRGRHGQMPALLHRTSSSVARR